ncbi:MAG: glutathione S-transferase [Herminiimonas sp.]|nr:glutathione S-transferase [Herminiimonas sp.]
MESHQAIETLDREQVEQLDAETAPLRSDKSTGPSGFKLVIANKNYSSWSMRAWVAMTAFGIPFEEVRIALDKADTSAKIAQYAKSGRLPVLLADQITIWDSLAICEYLAERFPEKAMWPTDTTARALARCMCAEMHSGFGGLRTAMPMNIRARFPGEGRTPEAQGDIGRICEIWEECLSHFGHHDFLFGDFSIADAYFAPVVTRFQTYDVFLGAALQGYMERVLAHPAVLKWTSQALAETEVISKYEAPIETNGKSKRR